MFAAEFEPAEIPDRRRSPRAPVSLGVPLGGDGLGRTLCRVVDVSIYGARLQTYSGLKKNSTIWLTLPQVGQVAAEVKWASDYVAGCQFVRPLHPDALDRLLQVRGAAVR